MKFALSLSQRYLLFLAAVIAAFIIGSQLITSRVVRTGLVELFRQRFDRAKVVLDQYATNHRLVRTTELETVLNSPRFIAAMETDDSATVASEMPVYQRVLGAQLLLVADQSGSPIFASEGLDNASLPQVLASIRSQPEGVAVKYLETTGQIMEILTSRVTNSAGSPVGWIAEGNPLSATLPEDLRRLTGFEVIISIDQHVIGSTSSPLVTSLLQQPAQLSRLVASEREMTEFAYDAEDLVFSTLADPQLPARVTFVSSLEEHVDPIKHQISLYLIVMAIAGGLLAMMAIYLFTSRRIGRQIDLLVGAAEKIAAGNFDFQLQAKSKDELGFLAGEFEKMRDRLVANRREIESAHASALSAERLAAIGKLATGIIHDFKNPMAVIRGTVDLIRARDSQNEKLIRYCTTIHEQVDRMVDLTRDVLDYSRGESRLALTEVNLAAYFESVATFHQEPYRNAAISLTISGPDELIVRLDSNRLRRVIDNILNNAREALKPGDQVKLTWRVDPEAVTITISDNGPGIPEKIKDTLFEPFVTSNKDGGTGLGLAIARKIVDDHGGRIAVYSAPAQGASFEISLPASLVVTATSPAAVSV